MNKTIPAFEVLTFSWEGRCTINIYMSETFAVNIVMGNFWAEMELGSPGDFTIFSGGSEKFSLIRCYLSNSLKEVRGQAMCHRTATAEALGWECAWHTWGIQVEIQLAGLGWAKGKWLGGQRNRSGGAWLLWWGLWAQVDPRWTLSE